jgi:hypothetical protein
MKAATKVMPVAAAVTALSTLACCLPLSLSAAIGIASLSLLLDRYRAWLVAIAVMFLVVGAVQLYRFNRACRKTSVGSVVFLVLAGVIVIGVSLFPQIVAVVLADLFS